MQDRYVGDIGDFAKYSLLNAVSKEQKLGVAWYRFPDEGHNSDGKHVSYLSRPELWRDKDPYVFDRLQNIVRSGQRSISSLRKTKALHAYSQYFEELKCNATTYEKRAEWREAWFNKQMNALSGAELVFADPDNGLCSDETFKIGSRLFWKRLPVTEAIALSAHRPAIIYHHNSRFKGGHLAEIHHWFGAMDNMNFAVRVRYYNARTFFFLNASEEIHLRAKEWCNRFGEKNRNSP